MAGSSDLGSVGFGLLSSASWGAGDFCGGVAGKRAPLYSVIISSQAVGFVVLLAAAILLQQTIPPPEHFLGGAVAGVVGAFGLFCLYYSLARGQMSVAAPISAVTTASLPVVYSALTIGFPGVLKLTGFAFALLSIWFISRTDHSVIRLRALLIPILAGVGFGAFFIIASHVSSVSYLWPLVGARAASLSLFTLIALVRREKLIPQRTLLPLTSIGGTLDAGGNVFYVIAADLGRLDAAAVLSSLYPAATILLAWGILREKIGRMQVFGVGLALLAIVLISLP